MSTVTRTRCMPSPACLVLGQMHTECAADPCCFAGSDKASRLENLQKSIIGSRRLQQQQQQGGGGAAGAGSTEPPS
jgi:hypothetical protein